MRTRQHLAPFLATSLWLILVAAAEAPATPQGGTAGAPPPPPVITGPTYPPPSAVRPPAATPVPPPPGYSSNEYPARRLECQRVFDIRMNLVKKHFDPRLAELGARKTQLGRRLDRLQDVQNRRVISMREKTEMNQVMQDLYSVDEAYDSLLRDKIRRESKIKADFQDCLKRARGISVPYR